MDNRSGNTRDIIPDAPQTDILSRFFLFRGIGPERAAELIYGRSFSAFFKKGEIILKRGESSKGLGLVLSGETRAWKGSPEEPVLMNVFKPGQSFGAAGLFQTSGVHASEVTASRACEIMFIGEDDLREIFKAESRTAENYISFLSRRLWYLNRKLDSLTAADAAGRLLIHLEQAAEDGGSQGLTMADLAKLLNIGRASLYRAAGELCRKGIVEKTGKTLTLKQAETLETENKSPQNL